MPFAKKGLYRRWVSQIVLFITLLIAAIFAPVFACTGIQLKADDNGYVNGRTVEFGMPLGLSAVIVPRNYLFHGTLPDGSQGMPYQSKYGAVGATMFDTTEMVDGINEKGLSVGAFYFPSFASYTLVSSANKMKALSPTEFANWILTQFANVDEVKKALSSVVIVPTIPKGWPIVPPLHYVVYDQTGKSIVIEPIDGTLKTYDNPIGVMTNSPTFDWHMMNLSNYVNLSPINAPAKSIDGYQLQAFSEGSGMHGLPGDFTSPSRFVRAAFFATSAIPEQTASDAVMQVFHILNQFDIPIGSVRDVKNKTLVNERTWMTTVKDSKNLKYYFKNYNDQIIKVIDLNQFNLDKKNVLKINMTTTDPVTNVSATAKVMN